jgi:hypothetical protein
MKYVLDASVALKWVLAEADSPVANKLRDDFVQQVHDRHSATSSFNSSLALSCASVMRRHGRHEPQPGLGLGDGQEGSKAAKCFHFHSHGIHFK